MSSIQLVAPLNYIAVPHPHLEIVEQPADFYRFRYESEITEGKVGGLLLGRSSPAGGSNKSFIKVKVSGIDPRFHARLQLVVCTVSPEKAPHPYYLHGENCKDGYFKLEKTVDDQTPSSWDVTFDRLAVICIQKTASAILEGLQRRMKNVPTLVNCPAEPSSTYDGRNLGRIRLAFSLSIQMRFSDEWSVLQIFSDEISDKKENKSLILEELNPEETSPNGGSDVAIYVKTATTGISKREAKVVFSLLDLDRNSPVGTKFVCEIIDVKKHLITVKTPNVSRFAPNERAKATVTVQVQDAVSSELVIVFDAGLEAAPHKPVDNSRKRQR